MAHFKIIEQLDAGMSKVIERAIQEKDIYEQLELFAYKFPDIDRDELMIHLSHFQKYSKECSYINQAEAMVLLQKSAVQLWASLPHMNEDNSHNVEFLAYLCCFYEKSYDDLNEITFNGVIQDALLEVRDACLEARALEESLQLFEQEEAMKKGSTPSRITVGSNVSSSIAARAALFQGTKTSSTPPPNSEHAKLQKEVIAARRRERESLSRASKIIDQEVANIDLRRHSNTEAIEKLKEKEDTEKKERDARKAAIKAKWETKVFVVPLPSGLPRSISK